MTDGRRCQSRQRSINAFVVQCSWPAGHRLRDSPMSYRSSSGDCRLPLKSPPPRCRNSKAPPTETGPCSSRQSGGPWTGCRLARLNSTHRATYASPKAKPRRGADGVLLIAFASTLPGVVSPQTQEVLLEPLASALGRGCLSVGCQTNGLVSISRKVCIGFSRRGRLLAVDLFSTCDLIPALHCGGAFFTSKWRTL